MEAQNATTVESITELTAGDTVTVTGNGMDVTADVADISHSSWMGKETATLEPTEGNTFTLTDSEHVLKSNGITAHVGAVTVELHN